MSCRVVPAGFTLGSLVWSWKAIKQFRPSQRAERFSQGGGVLAKHLRKEQGE